MIYIFLTPEIGSMGGSQMYVFNKSTYLKSKGWQVKICYCAESKLMIKKYNEFDCFFIPEMAWGIQYYLPSKVKKVVKEVSNALSNYENEIVIESCLFHLAFWGELLAAELNAKHIIDFLEEDIPSYSPLVAKFMEYKLRRWECLNASEKSQRRLFKSYYKQEFKEYEFMTDFYCSNVYNNDENENDGELVLEKSDYNILSIGRLDKPYIPEMIRQVLLFAKEYNKCYINLICIGGSPDGKKEEYIKEECEKVNNVKPYLLGNMFPINPKIVKKADVSIATSNSVLVSYNLNVPTIVVDANDSYAIGLYGNDTKQTVFRCGERQIPIIEYLQKVLINHDYTLPEAVIDTKSPEQLLEEHLKNQVEFIKRSTRDGNYYDVFKLYSTGDILRGLLVRSFTRFKTLCTHIY